MVSSWQSLLAIVLVVTLVSGCESQSIEGLWSVVGLGTDMIPKQAGIEMRVNAVVVEGTLRYLLNIRGCYQFSLICEIRGSKLIVDSMDQSATVTRECGNMDFSLIKTIRGIPVAMNVFLLEQTAPKNGYSLYFMALNGKPLAIFDAPFTQEIRHINRAWNIKDSKGVTLTPITITTSSIILCNGANSVDYKLINDNEIEISPSLPAIVCDQGKMITILKETKKYKIVNEVAQLLDTDNVVLLRMTLSQNSYAGPTVVDRAQEARLAAQKAQQIAEAAKREAAAAQSNIPQPATDLTPEETARLLAEKEKAVQAQLAAEQLKKEQLAIRQKQIDGALERQQTQRLLMEVSTDNLPNILFGPRTAYFEGGVTRQAALMQGLLLVRSCDLIRAPFIMSESAILVSTYESSPQCAETSDKNIIQALAKAYSWKMSDNSEIEFYDENRNILFSLLH